MITDYKYFSQKVLFINTKYCSGSACDRSGCPSCKEISILARKAGAKAQWSLSGRMVVHDVE